MMLFYLNFKLWQMLLPKCYLFHIILCQMLYQYMMADIEPIVVADVIAHIQHCG